MGLETPPDTEWMSLRTLEFRAVKKYKFGVRKGIFYG